VRTLRIDLAIVHYLCSLLITSTGIYGIKGLDNPLIPLIPVLWLLYIYILITGIKKNMSTGICGIKD
jgi:hypothetical protein